MNATQYEVHFNRRADNPMACACKHGHADCSDTPGGLCLDEEYSNMSEREQKKFEGFETAEEMLADERS